MAKDLVSLCCKKESENKKSCHDKKSCCSDHEKSDTSTKHTDNCKDGFCSSCIGCSIHGNILLTKYFNVKDYLLSKVTDNQNSYAYLTPHFDDRLKEIWQPPKL